MSPQAVRRFAFVAMLGGAAYVLSGVAQLASPEQTDPFSRASDHLIGILLSCLLLLTLAGFVALHPPLKREPTAARGVGRAFAR